MIVLGREGGGRTRVIELGREGGGRTRVIVLAEGRGAAAQDSRVHWGKGRGRGLPSWWRRCTRLRSRLHAAQPPRDGRAMQGKGNGRTHELPAASSCVATDRPGRALTLSFSMMSVERFRGLRL